MNEQLLDVFPEMADPEWIADREECWQLALEVGEWKSDYRKKDLESIRQLFFCGDISEGFPFSDNNRMKLMLFPIQTAKGYDYFYRNYALTEKEVESNFKSAFVSQQSSGMRLKEQNAYLEYHVGDTFAAKKTLIIREEELTFVVDSYSSFMSITSKFSGFLRGKSAHFVGKLVSFLPYYFDCYKHLISEGLAEKLNDEVVLGRLKKRLESGDCYVSKDDLESRAPLKSPNNLLS